MFSWSKKKGSKKRDRGEKSSEENEFGIKLNEGPSDKQLEAELRKLTGVQDLPEDEFQLNDGDEDVESELLRLMGGKGKKPARKQLSSNEDAPIDIMADITAEIDLGDEEVDVDENDPDLLSELLELTDEKAEDISNEVKSESESETERNEKPVNMEGDVLSKLKERLKMYKTAEEKAKSNNETSRARRFGRGIKTLEDLIKKAKAGKAVNENEIPPEIAMNLKPAPPPQPQVPDIEKNNEVEEEEEENLSNDVLESEDITYPPKNLNMQTSDSQEPENIIKILIERLEMYQIAESKAKEKGETTRARRFNRGIKTIQGLLKQAEAGKSVSSIEIPPKVALNLKPPPPEPVNQPDEENLESSDNERDEKEEENEENEVNDNNLENLPENKEVKETQEPEKNIMEILYERLQMYKAAEAKAKEMGEGARARRFLRGVKIIQDLIKQVNAGSTISLQDVPPAVALNLKPPPPPMPQPVGAVEEEENNFREKPIEKEDLQQTSDDMPSPIKFSPANDDFDFDYELLNLEIPTTVMEGLKQRINIYEKLLIKAQIEKDIAKKEECEKNIKLYLNAIETFKNGGYIDVLKLPAPKDAPPIPIPFYLS